MGNPKLNNPPLISEYTSAQDENVKCVCGSEENSERLTESMLSPPLPPQRDNPPVEMIERKLIYHNPPTRTN